MIIGYARTSTIDQIAGFEAQLRELEDVKCEKVFREQVSSIAVRAQLEAALEILRFFSLIYLLLITAGYHLK